MDKAQGPKTLLEAIKYFADENVCVQTLSALRWPDGVIPCPVCGCTENYYLGTRRVWKCKGCSKQFSIKVGTIFEDSPISLSKWLPAVWMICGAKNGISSYELHRAIGVTQKTAWFMLHRIRLAMQNGSMILSGEVEADESYIGGKARNMHASKRTRAKTGTMGKVAVMGMLERGGKVVTRVIGNPTRQVLRDQILGTVDETAKLFTDGHSGYDGLGFYYQHQVIDHATEYVRGNVHTNGIENYWSLLKRTLSGTYVSVEPFHLFRYLDEQAFRYNERKDDDRGRFFKALAQITGRRVTYNELTGKRQPSGLGA
jgi:transposase-like protein